MRAGRSPSRLGALALAFALGGCAHRSGPAGEAAQRMQAVAAGVADVHFEDEFVEGRAVLQALPPDAPERPVLRAKLLGYLLGPLAKLDATRLRDEVRESGADDVFDRVFESFRDALALFRPAELWPTAGQPPPGGDAERALLGRVARLVVTLHGARGGDAEVATALALLTSVESGGGAAAQLDELLGWCEANAESGGEGPGPRRPRTAITVLEAALGDWPGPAVVTRLERLYLERQKRFLAILRPGTGSAGDRKALWAFVGLHGEDVQRPAGLLATLWLRAGQPAQAARAAALVADQPGDDPELRRLLDAAAGGRSSAALLELARRFLPRGEALGGTAADTAEPAVAAAILDLGSERHPDDAELLLVAARVAHLGRAQLLAVRRMEDARSALEHAGASRDRLLAVSKELLDLYLLRLRDRLDPEHLEPAVREADGLRARLADARARFAGADLGMDPLDVDFELARGFVQAGQPDRASPLFEKARATLTPPAGGKDTPLATPVYEVALEIAKFIQKSGDPRGALATLEAGLARHQATSRPETQGLVIGEARLYRALGDVHELADERSLAEDAWQRAYEAWGRLMVFHRQRRDARAEAEALIEVARLEYLLGRHDQALREFDEAINRGDERDQSYIDGISFLVQHGELDAATALYRRALAKSDRAVSEYVKVYSSLWILDLSRRTSATHTADPAALAFLRTLDARHGDLRPSRNADWYRELARWAVGRAPYEDALRVADTPGRKAELFFYEAMRRLAEGQRDEAHALWKKVVDTRMYDFFEFDMASRYLREGAPSRPVDPAAATRQTI